MALVSKSKAAKLAGVSRTTIHRYVNDGKLSMTGDMLDTSELMRVFGSIRDHQSEQSSTGVQVDMTGHDVTPEVQGGLHKQISLLEAQVNDLRHDRDSWRQKSDELVELLRNEQESTKLLTHQEPTTGKAENLGLLLVAGLFVVGIIIVLLMLPG